MTPTQWHYANRAGQQQGPVTADELRAAFERGDVDASTLVWRDGFAQWLPLSQAAGELGLRNNQPPPIPQFSTSPAQAADARERMAYVPAPKKSMSRGTLAAILAGIALIVLVPISIVAAIAISQYQDYVAKAQFAEAVSIAQSLQAPVAEHYASAGTCPNTTDLAAGGLSGKYVARVEMPGGPAPCSIVLVFGDHEPVATPLRGGRVTFSGGVDGWTCRSGLPDKFKPMSCRGTGVY